MSLQNSMENAERAKLAVWDYPVSEKYTELWNTMTLTSFPNTIPEAIKEVLSGTFAFIGKNEVKCLNNVSTNHCLPAKFQ